MPNLPLAVLGFLISLAGAVIIALPIVARTDKSIAKATETRFGYNLDLATMFKKERWFARIGLGLVVVGSSLEFVAAL